MDRRNLAVLFMCLLIPVAAARGDEGYFDSNGVKIHYVVQGKGEPVLLIHGFCANYNFNWAMPGIINALSKNYQVIAYDNRGHGLSGKPHDPKKYGMEMVEDAVRLLDHLKIEKAHVVGYSMGAAITAKLLITHPDRLLSATLGGHGGFRENGDTAFLEKLANDLDEGKGIGALIIALTPPGKPKPTEQEIQIKSALMRGNDQKALAAVVRSWHEIVVPDDKLKSCTVPTEAIIGSEDPLKKGVDDLPDRLPGVKILVVEGADHMNTVSNPLFIKTLNEFLDSHHAK